MQAKSKVQTELVDELLTADDMAKNVFTEKKIQEAMNRISQAFDNYDLKISRKKAIGCEPASTWKYLLTMNGQRLQLVDKFPSLGSTFSRAVHFDDEVNARTAKASVAFEFCLEMSGSGIRLNTKPKGCKTVVLPFLLYRYALETWTVHQRRNHLRWTGHVTSMLNQTRYLQN